MNELPLVGLLLSILTGALIGAEREIRIQKTKHYDFAGFRTFTLISLLGFLSGWLSLNYLRNETLIYLTIITISALSLIAYRAVNKVSHKEINITSQIIALLSFIIGLIISLDLYQLAITLTIIIISILFLENALHTFAKKLKKNEIFATLKFAIISLIILPLLPNYNFGPLDIPYLKSLLLNQNTISQETLLQLNIFNPFEIWLFVVLISGISYIGYILLRLIGEKGIILTGFLGGLMSSTALTSSFAIQSKTLSYISHPLAIGTIIACTTMFLRVIIEVLIINPSLLPGLLLFFSIISLLGYLGAIILFHRKKLDHIHKPELKSPFALVPALKFALFFTLIILITKISTILFGEKGIIAIALLSGIADVDAITISLARLAAEGSISPQLAQIGIIIAAYANTLFKIGIAFYLGSKEYSRKVLYIFAPLLSFGILLALIIL